MHERRWNLESLKWACEAGCPHDRLDSYIEDNKRIKLCVKKDESGSSASFHVEDNDMIAMINSIPKHARFPHG
jgi:hypothetical protein